MTPETWERTCTLFEASAWATHSNWPGMVWRSTVKTLTWGGGGALGAAFFPQLTSRPASPRGRTKTGFGFTATLLCVRGNARLLGLFLVDVFLRGYRAAPDPSSNSALKN